MWHIYIWHQPHQPKMWLYIICIYQPTGQQASPYTISESFLWSDLFMLFSRSFSGLCSHLCGLTLLLNGCCEISAGACCHLMTTVASTGAPVLKWGSSLPNTPQDSASRCRWRHQTLKSLLQRHTYEVMEGQSGRHILPARIDSPNFFVTACLPENTLCPKDKFDHRVNLMWI